MLSIDDFDRSVGPEFLPSISRRAARRQFNISLALVLIFALAAASVMAFGTGSLRTPPASIAGKSYVQAPQFVHTRDAALPMSGG